jgi:hypothetical protein
MTNRLAALPKLRVTRLSWIALSPQCAQWCSSDVDSDDDELASEADFDDGFGGRTVERDTRDNTFDFSRLGIALAFDDFA